MRSDLDLALIPEVKIWMVNKHDSMILTSGQTAQENLFKRGSLLIIFSGHLQDTPKDKS